MESAKAQNYYFALATLWLIPFISIAQDYIPQTSEAGLNLTLLAGTGTNGVSVADYNQDGHLDVYFVLTGAYTPQNAGTWNRLFQGTGETFQEVNTDIGLYGKGQDKNESYMGNKLGASWGDYNNDGFPDIFLSNTGYDQLLKNNGDGTFSDITNTAGLGGQDTDFSSHGLWFDYDVDGDLDLYVSIWENYGDSNRTIKNRMYENTGNDTFTNVSDISGLNDGGKTWMSIALDVNHDGLPDLYLANDFGPNKLYINHSDKTFTEETETYGLQDAFEGMGIAIGDPNNDGRFDIYLTNATEKNETSLQINPLFIQQEDTTFESISESAGVEGAGWGWGTEFFDSDNDGWQDLFVVNGYFDAYIQPNRFFKNSTSNGQLEFVDASSESGLHNQEQSRTFVPFDYNNDGFLDVLISNFSDPPVLYKNTLKSGNWLKINLEGTDSNRDGFGSIIEVEAKGQTYSRYYHGAHFYGQSILPIHVGLGDATEIERITVKWLSGHTDEITNIGVNQTIKIREKEGLILTSSFRETKEYVPEKINLIGNYPNPFNGTTHIQFELKSPGIVEFRVFDVLGKHIYTHSHNYLSTGLKTISWDINSAVSPVVNSGIYFYRITINGLTVNGKMSYIK